MKSNDFHGLNSYCSMKFVTNIKSFIKIIACLSLVILHLACGTELIKDPIIFGKQATATGETGAKVPLVDETPAKAPLVNETPAKVPLVHETSSKVPFVNGTLVKVPFLRKVAAQVPFLVENAAETSHGKKKHSSKTKSHPDEVHNLPGLNFSINFRHYAGYVNAAAGKRFFYWFVESQRSPSKDPLLLWLNGGPGCSSVDGLLAEHGPFHVRPDAKTLYYNKFSWNKVANVFYIESPVGVGFSYSPKKNVTYNDDIVAEDNYIALQNFFKKFPEFKQNDFYITGESYAGVYIPTLSLKVLHGKTKFNFKGFAIGNGLVNKHLLAKSALYYGYFHGLLGLNEWQAIIKACCTGMASHENCDFNNKDETSDCYKRLDTAQDHIMMDDLNIYNIYANCTSDPANVSRYHYDRYGRLDLSPIEMLMAEYTTGAIPCIASVNVTSYLEQKAVREALHVSERSPKWEVCSDEVFDKYHKQYFNLTREFLEMLESGRLRGLIYNGDLDTACDHLGNEWFVSGLNLTVEKEHREWLYEGQIAGFVKYYRNLTYLTVLGSGHMVPQDKPGPALKMIKHFLTNEPY